MKENTIKNIYYPFRNNTDIYKWTSLFFNNTTKDNKIFLKEFREIYIYDNEKKKFYLYRYAILAFTFHINNIIRSKHIYLGATFICPKEFNKLFILLYLYQTNNLKIPGCFILVNNKTEISFILYLNIIWIDNQL